MEKLSENKILIVEDNPSDATFLKTTLGREDYQIIHAKTGTEAFHLLEKETPDLIILDILLPDIDGFEVCRRIRQNDRFLSLPVLFYSVIKTIDEKFLGLEMGASDFLTKTADTRELLIRIKNLLRAKRKIDEVIEQSLYDGLTKVYNRTYFHHRLEDECELSKRYKRNFSCTIIDIDNFKNINETYGYLMGDRVLKRAAEFMRDNIRCVDEICRYREDEFGVLFPETNLEEAYLAAERIRQYMLLSDLGQTQCPVRLTISCGVSSFNEEVKDTDDLLAQAITALSHAKQDGRNQTRAYSPLLK